MENETRETLDSVSVPQTEVTSSQSQVANVVAPSEFSKVLDSAKVETLKVASAEDEKFIADFKKELKDASIKSAQLEKEKQELEKKNIELQQAYIKTKNDLEEQLQKANMWDNKQKAREFHYNGLKDIMEFIRIKNPMCIPLMYFLAVIAMPIYLLWTLVLNPIGTLICGKESESRPKVVKGAIYTLLLLALAIAVGFGAYAVMHYMFKWF